ncbi:lipoprotein [uncultured Paraglaciecola sp.]
MRVLGLSLLVVFMLTACGQKRALYLPEKPTTNTTVSKPTTESVTQGKN